MGGNPTASGASTSFCSIREIASCMAVDQVQPVPSREEVGGLPSPGAAMPRLPNNPSRRPGKKLLLMGLSAARPTMTSGMTSGCLRGSLRSNSRTLPRWSVTLEESSPIRFFAGCQLDFVKKKVFLKGLIFKKKGFCNRKKGFPCQMDSFLIPAKGFFTSCILK